MKKLNTLGFGHTNPHLMVCAIVAALFIIVGSAFAQPTIDWQATYPHDLSQYGRGVFFDGSNLYVTGDGQHSLDLQEYDALYLDIALTDGSLVNSNWTATPWHGNSDNTHAYGITLSSGQVWIGGETMNPEPYVHYPFAAKLNQNGNFLFANRYPPASNQEGHALRVLSQTDGGVLLICYGWWEGSGFRYFVIKINSNGDQVWQVNYPGTAPGGLVADAAATSDGGCIITGRTYVNGQNDIGLLKISSDGTQQWFHTFSYATGDTPDEGHGVLPMSDGYVIAAWSNSVLKVFKVNTSGTSVLWEATSIAGANPVAIAASPNNGCAVATTNATLYRFDNSGALLWSWQTATNATCEGMIAVPSDNSYALVGESGSDVWVLKTTTDNGIPPLPCDVVPGQDAMTLEGQPNEQVSLPLTLTNNGGTDGLVNFTITGPDATRFSVQPTSITVPAGQSVTITVNFQGPAAGSYHATLNISPCGNRTVALTGNVDQPPTLCLAISPTDLERQGEVGQEVRDTLLVYNCGNTLVEVSNHTSITDPGLNVDLANLLSHGAFQVGDTVRLPLTAQSNSPDTLRGSLRLTYTGGNIAEATIMVAFTPLSAGSYGVVAQQFRLNGVYPNPFNPSTTIRYELPTSSFVRLEIYNIVGQRIRTLENAVKMAGFYNTVWNGTDDKGLTLPSGMYWIRLDSRLGTRIQKAMLLK